MKQLNNGLLVAIEGIDGSGKSSLARNLKQALENEFDILLTKEPGGTVLGKELRSILQKQKDPVVHKAEFLLFAADRAQHFETLVLPSLAEGKIVISDRMGDSSICYQGYGRGLDIDKIKQVNSWATSGRQPDLILYIDIDIEEAFIRINNRPDDITAFEKKEFIKTVSSGFKQLYKDRKDVVRLSGLLSEQEITQQATDAIKKIIKDKQ